MMTRLRFCALLVGMTVLAGACASDTDTDEPRALTIEEAPGWAEIFEEFEVTGTFALREVGTTLTQVHDAQRATDARLPASTFKILNSLVILETGVVPDVDTVQPWDGTDRGLSAWNQDHSLRTGIEVSAVWLYQQLAREVGEERMADWVGQADYGNADIDGGIDQFWLSGDLRISPLQQLDFLERLATDDLPFSTGNMAAVRAIIVRESGDGWSWSQKTGTALSEEPALGWLVGTTEYDGRSWVYALNIDMPEVGGVSSIEPDRREQLARRILTDAGALPAVPAT